MCGYAVSQQHPAESGRLPKREKRIYFFCIYAKANLIWFLSSVTWCANGKFIYSVGSRLDWLDFEVVVDFRFSFFFSFHISLATALHDECGPFFASCVRSNLMTFGVCTHVRRRLLSADVALQTNEIQLSRNRCEESENKKYSKQVRTADWLVKWRHCIPSTISGGDNISKYDPVAFKWGKEVISCRSHYYSIENNMKYEANREILPRSHFMSTTCAPRRIHPKTHFRNCAPCSRLFLLSRWLIRNRPFCVNWICVNCQMGDSFAAKINGNCEHRSVVCLPLRNYYSSANGVMLISVWAQRSLHRPHLVNPIGFHRGTNVASDTSITSGSLAMHRECTSQLCTHL